MRKIAKQDEGQRLAECSDGEPEGKKCSRWGNREELEP